MRITSGEQQTSRNALYNRGFFEGDIATSGISSNTIKEFTGEISAPRGGLRNAIRNPLKKWPKNGDYVFIPIQYSGKYSQKLVRCEGPYLT
uniref:Uncharacterized protein n=1 Tax=Acrobeloides nanus TaxID=290746 RepID=A0A914DK71_9BILA